jgi:hypothetical protein
METFKTKLYRAAEGGRESMLDTRVEELLAIDPAIFGQCTKAVRTLREKEKILDEKIVLYEEAKTAYKAAPKFAPETPTPPLQRRRSGMELSLQIPSPKVARVGGASPGPTVVPEKPWCTTNLTHLPSNVAANITPRIHKAIRDSEAQIVYAPRGFLHDPANPFLVALNRWDDQQVTWRNHKTCCAACKVQRHVKKGAKRKPSGYPCADCTWGKGPCIYVILEDNKGGEGYLVFYATVCGLNVKD